MARMIPNRFFEIENKAERKVYEWFENDSPSNWIVLHSYNISRNDKKRKEREYDFIVLAPFLGIFVLEVKGGQISYHDDNWYQSGCPEPLKRSPFKQASDGMHTVIDEIGKKIARITCGYGVMFPDMKAFKANSIQEEQWQVFDQITYNGDVVAFIETLEKKFKKYWNEKQHEFAFSKTPDDTEVKNIANLLRPDFDVPLIEKMQYERNVRIRLTETQYDHLDQIEANPQSLILIKGAAGTGKTFIAIEAALRFEAQGKKVAFFCYNTLLAKFLKGKFTDIANNTYARKFHDFGEELLRKAGIRPTYQGKDGIEKDYLDEITKLSQEQDQSEFPSLIRPYPPELLGDHDFWENTLPEKMLDALDKFPVEFDILIVDEAQDLIIDGYLQVFNRILKGGLKKGSCYFFGDFTGQMVTHNPNSIEEMEELLKKFTVFYTAHPLNINCRNTKNIGKAIMQLTGIEVPEKYLRDVAEGQEVWYEQWSDMAEQKKKLESKLGKLISTEKIRRKDITILSLKPWENSVVSHITTEKIADYSSQSLNDITFSIVRRVKGLENEVIILTDIESYENGEKIKEQLYVAMSRAISYLIIFESKNAQKERLQIMGSKE